MASVRSAHADGRACERARHSLCAQGKLVHRRRLVERSEEGYARVRHRAPAQVLFVEQSAFNGTVRVTKVDSWLALTFDASEQGLSYAGIEREVGYRDGAAQPGTLAFDYTRAMASALAGFSALQRPEAGREEGLSGRVMCVGLGSGTLPAFLAHHSPRAAVQVIELDPVVIRLGRDILRVRFSEHAALPPPAPGGEGFCVVESDGEVALVELAERVRRGQEEGCSALVLDAFDANARIPAHLQASRFLDAAVACLAPAGVLVVNIFNGPPDSKERKELAGYCALLRKALPSIVLFTVKIQTQQANVVVVGVRGDSPLGRAVAAGRPPTRGELEDAARGEALRGGWEFDAGDAVQRMFLLREGGGGALNEVVPGLPFDVWRESSAMDSGMYVAGPAATPQ